MVKKKTICLFVSLLAILAVAGIAFSQADTSMIIPGRSIGGINLGLDWNKILKGWGQPDEQKQISGGILYIYGKTGMSFLVNNGKIDSIYTVNPYHHTERGVKAGSLPQDVIREFGSGYQKGDAPGLDYYMYYSNKGISFSIIGGQVHTIQVLKPA
ncbi:MAG: hypothetical protein M1269_00480 [Chloroflexi bacterium]|nr:hypothetical protein [Chloroflexota bacterium]